MLKFSAKGEYALLLVQYLLKKEGPETLSKVSKIMGVSESFLRKIASSLEHAEILKTKLGRNGGVEIIQRNISVYEVLQAVQEDTSLVSCCTDTSCKHSLECSLKPLIHNLQRGIDSILKITKL